jgi:hypothetical protein
VIRILDESGLGLPEYYKWRSRSGCYFFFSTEDEWVGLLENHRDLYEKSIEYEREDPVTGERYTWSQNESLDELKQLDRVEQIKEDFQRQRSMTKDKSKPNLNLIQFLVMIRMRVMVA